MKNAIGIILLLVALMPWKETQGWGTEGHMIVGDVAETYLTDSAKAEVSKILGGQTLGQVASWADHVKRGDKFGDMGRMHYNNTPRGAESLDMERDCADGECVVVACEKYYKILSDHTVSDEERTEALKFLVHFVGDIHQPLHTGYSDDSGGNGSDVNFFGKTGRSNLHGMFDYMLIQHDTETTEFSKDLWRIRDLPQEKYNEWNALLRPVTDRVLESITDEQIAEWNKEPENPLAWANESVKIVLSIYEDYEKSDVIDQAYADKYMPVIEHRLGMGGVRLAWMINHALSSADSGSATKTDSSMSMDHGSEVKKEKAMDHASETKAEMEALAEDSGKKAAGSE